MSDTTIRHILLLRHIPGRGKVSVAQLREKLRGDGYDVHERTVQRDLNKLSAKFGIVGDDSKPQGWSWVRGSDLIQLPAMSPMTALTHRLVGDFLAKLLPRELYAHLGPQMKLANAVLADGHGALADWSTRVALVPMGPDRLAPVADEAVVEVVYDAVLGNRQIQVMYRGASVDTVVSHVLNPLALVVMDEVVYLVASYVDGEKPYQFALHRMHTATLLEDVATVPPGFTLRHYLREKRGFQYSDGREITLDLKVIAFLARQLEERPLGPGQRIRPLNDGRCRVSVRLELTEQLKWWLRSWGRAVEVVGPVRLRREFAAEFAELAARYDKVAARADA